MTDEQMKELAELRVAIQDLKYQLIQKHDLRELTEDTECQYCKQGCFRCDARKALTDEEIKNIHEETSWWGITDPIKFAKAILKKTSEK